MTRKVYDFAPEQLQNLTAIFWLHRGQAARFNQDAGGTYRQRFQAIKVSLIR